MKTHFAIGLLSIGVCSLSEAQITVQYGNISPQAAYQDASGVAITGTALNDLRFQLGIFDTTGGFVPSASNANLWADRWTPFLDANDSAVPMPAGGIFTGNPAQGNLSITENQTGAGTTFPVGAKLYLWGYRDGEQTFDGTPREWALLSNDNNPLDFDLGTDVTDIDANNWIVPLTDNAAITAHTGENDNLTVASADEEIVGSKFGNGAGIQFQTVVPEPSSIMLLSLSGLALLRRKR